MRPDSPVKVPQDAGAVLADANEDTVGLAHKQAGDFTRVAIQVDLSLHLHLGGLLFTQREVGWRGSFVRGNQDCCHTNEGVLLQRQIQLKIITSVWLRWEQREGEVSGDKAKAPSRDGAVSREPIGGGGRSGGCMVDR